MLTTKELAKTADAWFAAREKRLAADKVAADLKKKESELADLLINNLAKDATGISGKKVHVYVDTDELPKIVDREKFMKWVMKNGAFEMIPASVNKAPSASASRTDPRSPASTASSCPSCITASCNGGDA